MPAWLCRLLHWRRYWEWELCECTPPEAVLGGCTRCARWREVLTPLAIPGAGGVEPHELLTDPATPYWAQDTIRAGLRADPVDAANVLEVLAASFRRAQEQLAADEAPGQ